MVATSLLAWFGPCTTWCVETEDMEITSLQRLQGQGLATYAGWVRRTARYQIEGLEHLERAHAAGRPLIVAAWHGMTMMLFGFLDTHQDFKQYLGIVPDDPRGAVLSAWMQRAGGDIFAISMEATSMVAGRRLLALIRQMKQGKHLCLNPDGPDGPTHEPKKGVVFIARKAGALIIPTGAYTATGYRIPRWDQYTVPFPFSRIAVVLGEPLELTAEMDPEQARLLVRDRLNEVEQAAEEMYHRKVRKAG
jgi:lysophospholipid acyltransferase (LPLAT)-like uncharacterized protein